VKNLKIKQTPVTISDIYTTMNMNKATTVLVSFIYSLEAEPISLLLSHALALLIFQKN
jgi:hypothetical protein